jgi:hypothetical protein
MKLIFAFIAGAAFAGVLVSTALKPAPRMGVPACQDEFSFGPAYHYKPRPPQWCEL